MPRFDWYPTPRRIWASRRGWRRETSTERERATVCRWWRRARRGAERGSVERACAGRTVDVDEWTSAAWRVTTSTNCVCSPLLALKLLTTRMTLLMTLMCADRRPPAPSDCCRRWRTPYTHTAQSSWVNSGLLSLLRICFLPARRYASAVLADVVCLSVRGWLRGTAVERRSLAGELSLSCLRLVADGWPLMWVNRPL